MNSKVKSRIRQDLKGKKERLKQMKKSILLKSILVVAVLAMAGIAQAADLQWDFPSDWAQISGYVCYFNEHGQTDAPYIKNIGKADVVQNGVSVTYQGIEPKMNLQIGQSYDIYLTAWNAAGESGPSNTVQFAMPAAYTPPADSLPSGTVIT